MRVLYATVAMVIALAAAGAAAFAQQALPEGFVGTFRGTLSDAGGSADSEFTVVIKRSGAGFAVSWPPRITAELEPAGPPGVFRMGSRSPLLRGDPLYWARIDGDTLVVYAAQIDEHGGYRIDSFLYSVSGDGLNLVVRQLAGGAEPRTLNGRLSRHDG